MATLQEILAARKLPELMTMNDGGAVAGIGGWEKRRVELLDVLAQEVYGVSPAPVPASWKLEEEAAAYADKAVEKRFTVSFDTPKGVFSFPLYLAVPRSEKPAPCILLMNFRAQIPDEYYPVEEILDHGFATACVYYEDVSSDDADMENGLAGCYSLAERRDGQMGKIGCWAYAMSRAADVLLEQPELRKDGIITAGHSRLGKTSLWCAAQDRRVAGCISNDAGCSGDAVTRGKLGEHIVDITANYPFGFSASYQRHRNREEQMPFDQHFLLAAIAPRPLAIGSAQIDEWADPQSQLLSCIAAGPAWQLYGLGALAMPQEMIPVDSALQDGAVSFHYRSGTHFLSRRDWQYYLNFFAKKLKL